MLDNAVELIKNIKEHVDNPQTSDEEFRRLVRNGLNTLPGWLTGLDPGTIKKLISSGKKEF